MLIVAGLFVLLVTLFELLLLPSLQQPATAAWIVATGNLVSAGLVGYFVFTGLRPPQREPASSQAIRVVGDTLPLLRRGLNPETAAKVARVVRNLDGLSAVLIADRTGFLAREGDPPSWVGEQGLPPVLAEAMAVGRDRLLRLDRQLVALSLLRCRGEILGALALVSAAPISRASGKELVRMARVLGQLLSTQVELGQMDRQAQLVAEAELNALRAQINPHFLFNALNTIISYSRDDPETTRRLLHRLAELFRGSMQSSGQMIPLADEYEQIKNYLYIEQARFGDRLGVIYDIDPQVLRVLVPALSVQTLVENAVRHGLSPKAVGGTLTLLGRLDFVAMRAVISITDDGVGIEPDRIPDLLTPREARSEERRRPARYGMGLANVNERLRRLYGDGCRLQINSTPGKGTTVIMRIPMR